MANYTPEQTRLIISALSAPDSLTFADLTTDTVGGDTNFDPKNQNFYFPPRLEMGRYPAGQIFEFDRYGNLAPIPNQPVLNYATTPPQAPQGFSCPTQGGGNCFLDVPRDDVTILSALSLEDTTVSPDLTDVRGMRLCTIEGIFTFGVDPGVTPPPSDLQIQIALQKVQFSTNLSILFRGQPVSGYTDLPLSSVAPAVGCCDETTLCIDCEIPRDGSLSYQWTPDIETVPEWMTDMVLMLRSKFSGCGCSCTSGGGGCGCGAGNRSYLPSSVVRGSGGGSGGGTNNGTM